MNGKKWCNLRRVNENYQLEPEARGRTNCSSKMYFTQMAFDQEEDRLLAIDSAGFLYYIDLTYNCPSYQKLINVGHVTFVAFNPVEKSEILLGLPNADIKIIKLNETVSEFCMLIGHKVPPTHASFYKNYCMTCSNKEVILWCLNSCCKVHQLKIGTKNTIKKASYSTRGHITVLYQNDVILTWMHNQLEKDVEIDTKNFGMRNIRDFVFTRNARAMILAGFQNKFIILNTCNWKVLNVLNTPENFAGIKQISVVPLPLDGGASKVLACISSQWTLAFLDLNTGCLIHNLQPMLAIKKMIISPNGRFIGCIEIEGILKLIVAEKLFLDKCKPLKKEPCRLSSHGINDHMRFVRESIQELCLKKLLPILKEFGEYPEKHRAIIWSNILKLPSNKTAFNGLANKAEDAKWTSELLRNYPLVDRSQKTLLISTMNCLIQWCPIFAQSLFLPDFIFPFLTVFQKDLLLAFELILIVLLNHCQKWFEYHPMPPLNVLGIIENVLLESDPTLLKVFYQRGVTSSDYAWPLLKTAMSEVLSASEWLILWDHLITFQNTSLLLMCVVAYSICSRKIIISSLHTAKSIKEFFVTQSHISSKDLIKIARQLDKETPLRVHPCRYFRNKLIALPSKGPYPPFMLIDFPKFITDNSFEFDSQRLRKNGICISQFNFNASRISEKKRLERETKAFTKSIHEARLNEVQKCVKELNIPLCPSEVEPTKIRKHEKMSRDIDKLEYEVQNLIDSLRSRK